MSAAQLWLFPQGKPMREQFGDAFFKQAPVGPGVYIMTDRQARVIYVGQSRNLRRRLASYKNIRPDKDPRRLVRLARAAAQITWEPCAGPEEARLRENELLRLYRPKFNRVNTRPEAYGFIGLHADGEKLELWLTQDAGAPGELYGAFKGLRVPGYASLVRLLGLAVNQWTRVEEFPSGILQPRPPRRAEFRVWDEAERGRLSALARALAEYLSGASDQFLEKLREWLPQPGTLPTVLENLRVLDLETLAEFYLRGPRRNRELRTRHGIEGVLLTPIELDDLPVLTRAEIGSAC